MYLIVSMNSPDLYGQYKSGLFMLKDSSSLLLFGHICMRIIIAYGKSIINYNK